MGGRHTAIHARVSSSQASESHVNDSKQACGSRVDRHEHIGRGKLGTAGFRQILNDPRLVNVPRILETPKGEDDKGRDLDRVNLARLRRLIRR